MPTSLEYLVAADLAAQRIDAWSKFRLPFEPKGVKKQFRDELAASIRQLSPPVPGTVLHATYSSAARERADLENVLLYNVGCAPFRALARQGLVIERAFTRPSGGGEPAWDHHSRYGLGAAVFEQWRSGDPILEARSSGTGRVPRTAAEFWAATKAGTILRHGDGAVRPELGIRMLVTGMAVGGINWTARIKPLLDGVASALHVFVGPDLDSVSERASLALGLPGETVTGWLTDGTSAALGAKRFVWPFRQSLQWSPDDDRFVAIAVVATATDRPGWHVSAELFEALPRNYSPRRLSAPTSRLSTR